MVLFPCVLVLEWVLLVCLKQRSEVTKKKIEQRKREFGKKTLFFSYSKIKLSTILYFQIIIVVAVVIKKLVWLSNFQWFPVTSKSFFQM